MFKNLVETIETYAVTRKINCGIIHSVSLSEGFTTKLSVSLFLTRRESSNILFMVAVLLELHCMQ